MQSKILSLLIGVGTIVSIGVVSVMAQEANRVATIGTVDTKGVNALRIIDKKGGGSSFTITSKTKFFRGQTPITLADVLSGNLVAAIATQSGIATESATAATLLQKLYVSEASSSAKPVQQLVQGIVTGVNDGVITITKASKQDQFYNIPLGQETVIKTKDAKIASQSALLLGQGVAVVGTIDDTDTTLTPVLIQIVSK